MSLIPNTEDKVRDIINDLDRVSQMLHMIAEHEWDYQDCNTALCIANRNMVRKHWEMFRKEWWI
jgi:hypothetical protein